MGNTNTIVTMNGKPREANQGGTGTSAIVFTTDGTTPVYVPLPVWGQISGANPQGAARFAVRAWGRVVTAGSYNFTVALQYGTSATASSNSDISNSGAIALASLTTNWLVEADLVWDGDSNRINGYARNQVHTTLEAVATIDTAITGADPDAGTARGFLVNVTFGTGAAGNKAYLDGLQIDII